VLDFSIPKGLYGTGIGDVVAANNLSDLADVDAAWANLGSGDAGKLAAGTTSGTVAAGAKILGVIGDENATARASPCSDTVSDKPPRSISA
jgi:hypothetical protein